MANINYSGLRVLVADDFSNFRTTVSNMLNKLGVTLIMTAKDGVEAIDWCERKTFDVIMCDHDLGDGKNGQQVLEEIRHRNLICRSTLFLLVSADASKNVVMSAYDCEPDDYLTKPFNAQILHHRLNRLLALRNELLPVYQALENGNKKRAINTLTELAVSNGRHAVAAQKLLGSIFIEDGELNKAEKLYGLALQTRQVDWARLGLAKVKQLQREIQESKEIVEQIVEENPLYLPAYDVLAENFDELGDSGLVQDTIQRSVNISPMSILRQQRLADVANKNGDKVSALTALKSAVKLGANSCHGRVEDGVGLAKMAIEVANMEEGGASVMPEELIETLQGLPELYPLTEEQNIQIGFLEARLNILAGKMEDAKRVFDEIDSRAIKRKGGVGVDTELGRVEALQDLGDDEQADAAIQELIQKYTYDEDALEKLDSVLSEPVSESNQQRVSEINREGIKLYNQGLYDDSLECFERAKRSFPKHIGIQLNIIQTLIGKVKDDADDLELCARLRRSLEAVRKEMDEGHSQYKRYRQLKTMAEQVL